MNRKELPSAVHAGTDGLRGMTAANAAVDVMIKQSLPLLWLKKM
jgi:hypothetical protein